MMTNYKRRVYMVQDAVKRRPTYTYTHVVHPKTDQVLRKSP